MESGCPSPAPGKRARELKNSFVLWHDAKFETVLAAKGRHELLGLKAFQDRLAVLAQRAHKPRPPKPPRIQAFLKRALELKTRLMLNPGLTRDALAQEIGIDPSELTRLLHLADLAPKIQRHILALPPIAGHGPITERRLRPISRITDRQEQLDAFCRLLMPKPSRADQADVPDFSTDSP